MKLYYFDIAGKAEIIRYILYYNNVEFEDVRFAREDWATKYKSQMPFGQVPVLDMDGKKYAQSGAIARYLGNKYNLLGKDELEKLEVDMWTGLVGDMELPLRDVYLASEDQKEEKKKVAIEKIIPLVELLEKQAAKCDGKFFFGNATLVDFSVTAIDIWLKSMLDFDMSKFPSLNKIKKNVTSNEGISKYLKSQEK
ncbi:hypothetical protein SNEBB_011456 [Seison nebaliae]|nr:hypothetical protein SNEBB_011456 [Seison nebaliae]